METSAVTLLLSRRMTILLLTQLLDRLAQLSELGKTPSEYWHDVLQIAHQGAMEAKAKADQADKADQAEQGEHDQEGVKSNASANSDGDHGTMFLATELTIQMQEKKLMLAFKGLPMPEAMTQPRRHSPVLAIPLQTENVHQLIELLINRAEEAQWNLPLDLPWRADDKANHTSKLRRDN